MSDMGMQDIDFERWVSSRQRFDQQPGMPLDAANLEREDAG